ncbi:IS21 family transposase [Bacillus stratosphericus]|nr:IS21 family transposase [Bacillus stratosphericus]
MLCMETIAKVHRLFHRQKLSQREIAKQLKLSRNTVAKYLQHATVASPVYRREQTHYPKLGPFLDVLTQQLLQEAQLPKQQHLSARRHFERLKDAGYAGQYSAVAVFIRKFRQQHQPKPVPVFMAQAFAPGDAYQFDWSIETVCLAGQTVKVNIAHFRLCHSRAFFVCAYPNQKADMLMDAHNRAFAFFGGVPARGIYDNMKTAVTRIGKGKEREFNAQFLQMMTHFLIEPVACTPASGWEKGQVERQIRHLRERLFKPTLAFDSFTSLNDYLQQQCLRLMRQHKHPEYRQPVNDIWEREKHSLAAFRPYPAERLEILKVSNQSLVTVERHRYSVPVRWAGNTVRVYIGAQTVRFCSDTDCIAEHPRSFVKDGTSYNPWHFLPYLQKKPGALRDGRAFTGWVLPPVIERLKACLLKQPKGDRVMVKLLNLMAEYDADLALTAAELALDEGMPTPEAVLNIINRLKEPPPPRFHIRDIPLTVPPSVDCSRYDRLLSLSGKQTDTIKEKHHAA